MPRALTDRLGMGMMWWSITMSPRRILALIVFSNNNMNQQPDGSEAHERVAHSSFTRRSPGSGLFDKPYTLVRKHYIYTLPSLSSEDSSVLSSSTEP